MLNLNRLRSINLHSVPLVQRWIGHGFLLPSYRLLRRTHIVVDGREHIPAEPVLWAMNHTDRYNYWPFQYWLWRQEDRFTATWVKGKYYENRWLGKFMEMTNNIPAPSKGYIMTRDFVEVMGRSPKDAEYKALRDLVDGVTAESDGVPDPILRTPRDMLGRAFDPVKESYADCVAALLEEMSGCFQDLNTQAFDKNLDVLIFPQGTRSIRLSKGYIGLVQAALHYKKGILPIGCSGCDKVYPGSNPWARGGTVHYRMGEYMPYDSFPEAHLPEGVNPFEPEAIAKYRPQMQALVDVVMQRLNGLVDPAYRFAEDSDDSDGVKGARRFV